MVAGVAGLAGRDEASPSDGLVSKTSTPPRLMVVTVPVCGSTEGKIVPKRLAGRRCLPLHLASLGDFVPAMLISAGTPAKRASAAKSENLRTDFTFHVARLTVPPPPPPPPPPRARL
jgi:hypothetical protein